jgi:hypothetical protein
LAIATAFAHLILSSTRPPATDLRAWFAVAAVVSLVFAIVAWSSQGRAVGMICGIAAMAAALLALALIGLRVAHETGVVLLVGGTLNAAIANMSFRARDELAVDTATDSL